MTTVHPAPTSTIDPETARVEKLQRAAELSPNHPALAWQINGALLAHRRGGKQESACGRSGELTVVIDRDVPPCPKCFRP